MTDDRDLQPPPGVPLGFDVDVRQSEQPGLVDVVVRVDGVERERFEGLVPPWAATPPGPTCDCCAKLDDALVDPGPVVQPELRPPLHPSCRSHALPRWPMPGERPDLAARRRVWVQGIAALLAIGLALAAALWLALCRKPERSHELPPGPTLPVRCKGAQCKAARVLLGSPREGIGDRGATLAPDLTRSTRATCQRIVARARGQLDCAADLGLLCTRPSPGSGSGLTASPILGGLALAASSSPEPGGHFSETLSKHCAAAMLGLCARLAHGARCSMRQITDTAAPRCRDCGELPTFEVGGGGCSVRCGCGEVITAAVDLTEGQARWIRHVRGIAAAVRPLPSCPGVCCATANG